MYKSAKLKLIKALTSVHAGAGQSLSYVDMPIQRESYTNIPKIESSSLKGSLKHHFYKKGLLSFENDNNGFKKSECFKNIEICFGKEDGEKGASSLTFTDAKLLFMPIRSGNGVFKLITCPYVLERFIEQLVIVSEYENDKDNNNKDNETKILERLKNLNLDNGEFVYLKKEDNEEYVNKLLLEEYIFEKKENGEDSYKLIESYLGNDNKFDSKYIILNDDDFIDLVSLYTEIITRNKIDSETGVSVGNALFTEEYLPSESILYFTILDSALENNSKSEGNENEEHKDSIEYFEANIGDNSIFQVGGNKSIGKGFVKILN